MKIVLFFSQQYGHTTLKKMIINDDNHTLTGNTTNWSSSGISGKLVSIALIILIIAAVTAIIWISLSAEGNNIIEFYILNEFGQADNYPTEINLGETFSITTGIINNSSQEKVFHIISSINGTQCSKAGPIIIGHNDKYENSLLLSPAITGEHQKVEFSLFEDNSQSPMHTLILWIDVADGN